MLPTGNAGKRIFTQGRQTRQACLDRRQRASAERRAGYHRAMRRKLMILLWRALALLSLALGVLGIFLPGLPTVPFVLAAAWAAGHGWPRLEAWLLAHQQLGPPIRRWRDHGAIPRRAKWLACVMMSLSAALMWYSPVPRSAQILVSAVMIAVAVWMWRRPEV